MRLFSVFLISTVAAAAEPVAPLELFYPKAMSPEMQGRLEEQLREALASKSYELQQAAEVKLRLADARVPPRCFAGPCLRQVGSTLRVKYVLIGGVEGTGSTYDLSLTVLETGKGDALAQVAGRCDVCTFNEVESTMRQIADTLAGQLVSVVHPDLAASPASPPTVRDQEEPGTSRPGWGGWKWITLGVGVVALGAGAALFAVDGNCATEDSMGECSNRYSTDGGGMVLLAAGTAAIGGSGLLYLFGW